MGKECSQLFSVLIISDVEEMEGLWVDASPAEPWGAEEEAGVGRRGRARGKGVEGDGDSKHKGRGEEGGRIGNGATSSTSREQKVGRGAV